MEKKCIDGVNYTIGTFNYGEDAKINDKIMSVEFDPKSKTAVPIMKAGLQKFLTLLASMKSWDFRGVDNDGGVVLDTSKPILPINEANLALIPRKHGNELGKIASKLNGFDEDDEKNSRT